MINLRAVSAVFITKTQTGASGGSDCIMVEAGKRDDEILPEAVLLSLLCPPHPMMMT